MVYASIGCVVHTIDMLVIEVTSLIVYVVDIFEVNTQQALDLLTANGDGKAQDHDKGLDVQCVF